MAKLVMCTGISGSGKSTWAENMTGNGNYFRVNRDSLRKMMYSGKWNGRSEKAVISAEKAMVEILLKKGVNVIVDDTNLLASHFDMWKMIAGSVSAAFEIKAFKPSIQLCVERDRARSLNGGHSVGGQVIHNQAIKSELYAITPGKPIAIFDIDGTLAKGNHRQPLLKDKKDPLRWKKYFALAGQDEPIWPIINKLKQLRAEGYAIIILSGRSSELCWDMTEDWLAAQGITYDFLLMRRTGDLRPDTQVKYDLLQDILINHDKKQIKVIYDDRPQVIKGTWLANNMPIIPVYQGDEIPLDEFFTGHHINCLYYTDPIDGRCSACGGLEDF